MPVQQAFAVGVLKGLNAPVTPQNVQALVGWIHAESGSSYSGVNGSIHNNPLNTTQPAPGSYGTGSQGNIQSYPSLQTGLGATIKTLQNGYYGQILAALRAGNNPQAVASAIGSSKWGTSGSLASQAIAAVGPQPVGGGGISGTGGIAPAPGGQVARKLGMTQPTTTLNKAAIVSNYLANEPRINPFTLPIPGTRQTTGTDVPASSNPLLQPGQPLALGQPLTKTIPGHMIRQAQGRLQGLAGNQPLHQHPGTFQGSGYVNPIPHATYVQTDQGVDINLPVGAPIRAIGDSKVIGTSPGWYAGQPYVLFRLLNGPQAGKYYYVAEQFSPTVKTGQTVRAGQTIGTYAASGTGIEMGWGSSVPGRTLTAQTAPQQVATRHAGAGTTAGNQFRNFLHGLGAL